MRIHETLARASRLASSRRQAAELAGREEEQRLWIQVKAYRDFLAATGQVYLFEDYLDVVDPTLRPQVSTAIEARPGSTSRRVMTLLMKAFDETPEKHSPRVLIQLVNFIADTGQLEACEDYIHHRLEYAPLAIAHFPTHAEAEAWLNGLAEPPSPADILIGDEYHLAWYSREDSARGMYRDYVIEPYIEEFVAQGIPPTAPSFETRAEAEGWLKVHPATPFDFVSIAGEYHLAVHHKRLKRHTLHPVASSLVEWEEKKRATEREEARNLAAKTEEDDE